MNIALLSILFLVLSVAIGYKTDINVGILAIAFAFILALIGGLDISIILDAFPSKLFLTLLGTMYLFSMLQDNGTLSLLSQKLVSLVGKRAYLIPIIVYIISYLISAAGPGAISAQAIMIIFSVTLSVQLGIKPYMISSMAILGTVGGTVSPIALTGIIVSDLTQSMNLENVSTYLLYSITIMNALCALAIYIIFKGYKLKISEKNILSYSEIEKFSNKQWLGLIGMLALVIAVLFFKMNVGLVAFAVAIILSLLKSVDHHKAFKLIPWSVLILVGGMSILMDVTFEVGGIKLLTDLLSNIMNKATAAFIMTLTSGITGWFSSGNGVVIPTFVPTVPELSSSLQDTSQIELIISIVAGATVGGLSPFDSGGSMIIGSYAQETGIDDKEQQKMFLVFFGLAVFVVFFAAILGLLGLFRIFN